VELFIIRVKFAIYYFLHFNTVRQVAARLRAKSAIYDCLVIIIIIVIIIIVVVVVVLVLVFVWVVVVIRYSNP